MKVALTVWNGRISPVVDVARQILVVDVEGGQAANRREEALPGTDPGSQAERLAALGVDVLIGGAVSRPMAALLASKAIRVVGFTAGTTEDVLDAWMDGRLPDDALTMPGCGGRRRRRGRTTGCQSVLS